jgi:hypothetical protein
MIRVLKYLLTRFGNNDMLDAVHVGGMVQNRTTIRRSDCGWVREMLEMLENDF